MVVVVVSSSSLVVMATTTAMIGLWTFLHSITDTPMFLLSPSFTILKMRMKALLGLLPSTTSPNHHHDPILLMSYNYRMPPIATKIVFFRTMIILFTSSTIHSFLWLIDEILYGKEYRNISLNDSVFLVGAFRTGSTSLHRALALDEERFVSPRFIELWYPFICIQKIFDWLERRDKMNGTTMIRDIEHGFQQILGKEVMERHPMHWYQAEEDDWLLASWHLVGWFLGCSLPHPEAWVQSGRIQQLPKEEQYRSFLLYKRTMQKILYRRGHGRALLSKSHLIDLMPIIADNIKGAKFVGLVRHPADAFCSWYGLTQTCQSKLTDKDNKRQDPKLGMVQAHWRFWDCFTKSEMNFFLNKQHNYHNNKKEEEDEKNFAIVRFADYIADQDQVIHSLYKSWGYPVEGTKFEKRLQMDRSKHKSYKTKRRYSNPTLEDLEISRDMFDTKYADYLEAFSIC